MTGRLATNRGVGRPHRVIRALVVVALVGSTLFLPAASFAGPTCVAGSSNNTPELGDLISLSGLGFDPLTYASILLGFNGIPDGLVASGITNHLGVLTLEAGPLYVPGTVRVTFVGERDGQVCVTAPLELLVPGIIPPDAESPHGTVDLANLPAFLTTTTLTFSLGQLPDGIVLTSADVEPAPIDGPKEIDPSDVTSTTGATAGGSSTSDSSVADPPAAGSSGEASTDSGTSGDASSTDAAADDSPAVAAPSDTSSGVSGSGFVILSLLTGLGSVLLGLGGAWLLGRRRS